MEQSMDYEYFMRRAFAFPNRMQEPGNDPAHYAREGFFSHKNINRIKAGVGYGMAIITYAIRNYYFALPDQECDRIDEYTDRIIGLESLAEIHALIEEFRSEVEFKYFKGVDGFSKYIIENRNHVFES